MNETEKKLPVRNLERISEKKFKTFDAAKANQKVQPEGTVKAKIFARYDGTYDLVFYRKIGEKCKDPDCEVVGEHKTKQLSPEVKVRVHQKSKDRKKSPKKAR